MVERGRGDAEVRDEFERKLQAEREEAELHRGVLERERAAAEARAREAERNEEHQRELHSLRDDYETKIAGEPLHREERGLRARATRFSPSCQGCLAGPSPQAFRMVKIGNVMSVKLNATVLTLNTPIRGLISSL
jgi:hypothetical protein